MPLVEQTDYLLKNLIEAAPDAIVVINDSGRIILVNRQTEKLFGYSRQEMIDHQIEMLVPDRLAAQHVGSRTRFALDPTLRPMGAGGDLKGRRKDGSEVAVDIMLSPVEDPSGHAVIATVRDASARQRAADKLATSEAMFRALYDQAPDAIIGVDKHGRIMQCNRKVEDMFGFEPSELAGKPIEMLVPDRFRAGHVSQRDGYSEKPVTRPMGAGSDLFAKRKDGSEFPVDILLSPVKLPGSQIVISVVRDVTERKRAERQLEDRAGALARSNAELEQFAYVASHDLQEPLRAVASSCQVLQRRHGATLDDDSNEYLQFAVDGAKRMQELINDLLVFSRAGRNKAFEDVEMSAALERALANLQAQIRETNAVVSSDQLPRIHGDASQLVQLLQNLIQNGIKFRRGSGPVIRVGVVESPGHWTFSVKDDGIGIPKEYQTKIFVIFQRLHRREEYAGTGIGLAICKKVVECHGGRIWVESEANGGATFFFTIPKDRGCHDDA